MVLLVFRLHLCMVILLGIQARWTQISEAIGGAYPGGGIYGHVEPTCRIHLA